jgi:hypothetical protein
MKNVWLHGVYLTLIGILAFQLYSTTKARDLAFGQVEEVLKKDFQILEGSCSSMYEAVCRNCSIDSRAENPNYLWKVKDLEQMTRDKKNYLDRLIFELKNGKTLNLKEIKSSLNSFSDKISSYETNKLDSSFLNRKYCLKQFTQSDLFDLGFNVNPTIFLTLLKNQIKIDEATFYNHAMDKTTRMGHTDHGRFRIAIMAKNMSIIEGEKFEAELYLSAYSSNPGAGVVFTVNNQNLPIKEGVARYIKIEPNTGIKTIHAQASVRNPATGEVSKVQNDFQYHVLPKCSQNCQ